MAGPCCRASAAAAVVDRLEALLAHLVALAQLAVLSAPSPWLRSCEDRVSLFSSSRTLWTHMAALIAAAALEVFC